jgi:hypothetical protein
VSAILAPGEEGVKMMRIIPPPDRTSMPRGIPAPAETLTVRILSVGDAIDSVTGFVLMWAYTGKEVV